jgi:hypothetical protein
VHLSEELCSVSRRVLIHITVSNNDWIEDLKPAVSCEIPYRLDEKFWVIASKNDVTVSFAMQFENPTDRALARIFLLVHYH